MSKKYAYKNNLIKKEQPIMIEPIEQIVIQEQIIEPIVEKTYQTTAKLNLREDAGMDKNIITIIPKGDKVNYYGYSIDNWYYVKYKDFTGFCLKNWLQ